jgi:DNA-binding MarR family transcriptional regulator
MDDPPTETILSARPGERLAGSSLSHEVEFVAARARSLGTSLANAALAPLGLKVRSYSVLALACSGMNPSQRELAEFLLLDASQIVGIVDDLEDAGLVVRTPDPDDRRARVITGTAAGLELFERAQEAARGAEDAALVRLDPQERAELLRLLRRVALD